MGNVTARRANIITPVLKIALFVPVLFLPFYQQVCLSAETAKPSYTAERCALYRAIGAMEPDESIRSNDTLAVQMIGKEFWEQTPYTPDYKRTMKIVNKYKLSTYFYVNARTKHIDALLSQTVARGVRQVVILGAGYDSRAYRFKEFPADVRFFEVDLPAIQEVKKARVMNIFGSIPPQVAYVPIDFNTQSLEHVLSKANYDPSKRAFFILEGVTMYLNGQGVVSTLNFIVNNSAPGSSVVFDYVLQSVIDGTTKISRCKRAAAKVAEWGEPWLFGIKAGGAGAFLSDRGFVLLCDLGPEALEALYLPKVQERLQWPKIGCGGIVHAAVPYKGIPKKERDSVPFTTRAEIRTAEAPTQGSGVQSPNTKSSAPARIRRLIKALNLDQNQQAQIWKAYNEAREKIIGMMKSGAGPDEISEAREEAREEIRAKIRGLLTPQQKKKYRELMSSH